MYNKAYEVGARCARVLFIKKANIGEALAAAPLGGFLAASTADKGNKANTFKHVSLNRLGGGLGGATLGALSGTVLGSILAAASSRGKFKFKSPYKEKVLRDIHLVGQTGFGGGALGLLAGSMAGGVKGYRDAQDSAQGRVSALKAKLRS